MFGSTTFSAMEDPHGTGERLVQVENAALFLADDVEDLIRDMETIVLNLPDATKRTHELGQVNRARKLARVVRAAVADARRQAPGSMST
jgi:hypothetical protein